MCGLNYFENVVYMLPKNIYASTYLSIYHFKESVCLTDMGIKTLKKNSLISLVTKSKVP